MFGKVFCLYLVLLMFMTIVTLYAWLSGMNIKPINIGLEITAGAFCLLCPATLFHFCNYAHHFNIVRHGKILFEYIYIYIYIYIYMKLFCIVV